MMKKSYTIKISLRIFFLLALSLFLIEETIRLWFPPALFGESDVSSIERSLVLNPADAELNSSLGRVYHMLTLEDEKEAESFYVKSLELNPVLSSSWLGLTEIFVENGENQKALSTLRRLSELTPKSISYLWEESILSLRLGDKSMAMRDLRIVAKVDPTRRERVFNLCWEVIGNPEFILSNVITDESLPDYLWYLMLRDKLDETFPVWKRMKKMGIVSDKSAFSYIEFLLAKDRSSEASSIWSEMFGKRGESLVWNGGFEKEPLGRGFDWRIQNVDGVSIDFDWEKRSEGTRSLRLKFDGKHNVDFYHVYQVIPVEPDTDYFFTSYVSTQEITTRNGITWEVYCYPKLNMTKAMEPLTGTTDWKRVELSFHTPSDCKSIVLRLRRYRSERLDKYIYGVVWVDDVKLLKIGISTNAQSRDKGI
jgi:hypothetical protein